MTNHHPPPTTHQPPTNHQPPPTSESNRLCGKIPNEVKALSSQVDSSGWRIITKNFVGPSPCPATYALTALYGYDDGATGWGANAQWMDGDPCGCNAGTTHGSDIVTGNNTLTFASAVTVYVGDEVSGWVVYCHDFPLLPATSCCSWSLLPVPRRSTHT